MDEKYIARFWSRVEKTEGCWLWTAGTVRSGYGALFCGGRDGQMIRTHRFSWLLHFGPIPDGLLVCHRCDVRRCVRPDHLFLGTQAENMTDKVIKGRAGRKLNPQSVREIRDRLRAGESQVAVAKSFSVDPALVWRIGNGKQWGWVT